MYRIRANQLKIMKATEKKYAHLNTYKTVHLFSLVWFLFSFVGLFYKSGKFNKRHGMIATVSSRLCYYILRRGDCCLFMTWAFSRASNADRQ